MVVVAEGEEETETAFLVLEMCGGRNVQSSGERMQSDEKTERKMNLGSLTTSIHACYRRDGVMECLDDCRPETILVDVMHHTDITIKLYDFGTFDMHRSPGAETWSAVVKSSCYVPGELVFGRRGPAGEVWAAGITLYHKLSGTTPVSVHSLNQFEEQLVANETWQFFAEERWHHVFPASKILVSRMFAFNPSKRSLVQEFFNHLWVTGRLRPKPLLPRLLLPLTGPLSQLGSTCLICDCLWDRSASECEPETH